MRKEQSQNIQNITTRPSIRKTPKRDYYPVSLQQEGVWLQARIDPESIVWNISHSWRYQGQLNIKAFKKAIRQLIRRQTSLRTNFQLKRDKIFQVIHDTFAIDSFFTFIDISSHPEENKESTARNLEKEAAQEPYDLENSPLARFTVIRFNENDHLIGMGLHHIITDVTSRQILWRELVILYNSYAFNKPVELEPITIHYHDYAVWQQEFLRTPYYEKQKKYWLSHLWSPLPMLNLPLDFPRREKKTGAAKICQYTVPLVHELATQLRTFSLRNRTPFSAVFLLAFYILLQKYSNQSHMMIGTLYSGRNHNKKVLNKLIGLFANSLALRLNMNEDASIKELLKEVAIKTTEAYENQDFLFEELIRTLHPERNTLHAPIFQVVFNMIKFTNLDMDLAGLIRKEWESYKPDNEISSRYNLSFYIRDEFKKITVRVLYTKDRFTGETIKRIVKQYITILSDMINEPGKKLPGISIITEEEKQTLLYEFNETKSDYPRDKTLHQLFEEQVERTPDKEAVVGNRQLVVGKEENLHLTYKHLNEKSDQLANHLREKGVSPDTIVSVMMEHSVEIVNGILGILKTGGAYLPIDPGFPPERIEYMLADSQIQFLLIDNTSRHLNCQLSIVNYQLSMNEKTQPATVFSNPQPATGNWQLAYLIYTSGSTGKPKGVMINHRSAVNYVYWAAKVYIKNRNVSATAFPLYTSISFDLTVTSIFTPLATGNKIVVYGGKNKELLVGKVIEENRVGIVKLTPTHLRLIKGKKPVFHSMINCFIVGGEELDTPLARDINKIFKGKVDIYNEYGPTEATVGCMIHKFDPGKGQRPSVPMGVPADNVRIYILDKHKTPVSTGIPGELYISGDGAARGYLNRPELTAEKFDHDLWDYQDYHDGNHRSYRSYKSYIYRTGDLARWLSDGNIEFLGRIDRQVKIRGYRIELGEIETRLNEHKSIKESVVIPITDKSGEKSLCAYLVSKETFTITQLREYLEKKIPAYMVPSYFVQIEKIPLTSNGKVDRKSLPGPDKSLKTAKKYAAPGNEVEKQLVEIWQELLHREKIGINDNFFELGGHSLIAMNMVLNIHKYFGIELSLWEIFDHPTISGIAKLMYIQEEKQRKFEQILKEIENMSERQVKKLLSESMSK